MEDENFEAKLLARELSRRAELLKVAKGDWRSLRNFEIVELGCFVFFLVMFSISNIFAHFAVAIFCFLTFGFSVVCRQIHALIELLGEEELLKRRNKS